METKVTRLRIHVVVGISPTGLFLVRLQWNPSKEATIALTRDFAIIEGLPWAIQATPLEERAENRRYSALG